MLENENRKTHKTRASMTYIHVQWTELPPINLKVNVLHLDREKKRKSSVIVCIIKWYILFHVLLHQKTACTSSRYKNPDLSKIFGSSSTGIYYLLTIVFTSFFISICFRYVQHTNITSKNNLNCTNLPSRKHWSYVWNNFQIKKNTIMILFSCFKKPSSDLKYWTDLSSSLWLVSLDCVLFDLPPALWVSFDPNCPIRRLYCAWLTCSNAFDFRTIPISLSLINNVLCLAFSQRFNSLVSNEQIFQYPKWLSNRFLRFFYYSNKIPTNTKRVFVSVSASNHQGRLRRISK